MNECKICSKDLYENISFKNIFKFKYCVHDKCIDNVVFNSDRLSIPIMNNLVYYDYLIYEIDGRFDVQYFELNYMGVIYSKILSENMWSIIIYYEEGIFSSFSADEFLLLFSLSNSPFMVISLLYFDFAEILAINL